MLNCHLRNTYWPQNQVLNQTYINIKKLIGSEGLRSFMWRLCSVTSVYLLPLWLFQICYSFILMSCYKKNWWKLPLTRILFLELIASMLYVSETFRFFQMKRATNNYCNGHNGPSSGGALRRGVDHKAIITIMFSFIALTNNNGCFSYYESVLSNHCHLSIW